MRIGITCYPTYGGSGIVATELGLELANRGHQIHFITYANPIRLQDRPDIVYHEVEVSNYPLFQYPPYCLALASRMLEVAVEHDLDLLHVHYAIPHSVSAMLARGMMAGRRSRPLPFVTTLHGTDISLVGVDRSYFAITKYSIEESDAVTSISNDLRNQTVEVFGVAKPIDVIHNFVNPALYCPLQKPASRRMIHLSNFRPVKRVLDCVRILAAVRREIDAELWMVGDGPDRGAAERLANDLGLSGHVRFLGKRNDVPALLREADVLLMPSEMESFGLAALEGMASGVVPIGTRVGGVPELVDDGVSGFLCQVGDVESMAARASDVLRDPAIREAMGSAARRIAEERFSTELVIPRYEAIYRRVTG